MTSRFSLVTAFAAVAMTAAANAVLPQYFLEDWSLDAGEGWEMSGSGKTPAGPTASLVDTDSWSMVEFPWGESFMASTSTTGEGGRVSCRLVSPEIDIPADGAVLSFDVANWNPERDMDNKLSVYVVPADDAEAWEDYDTVFSGRISANNYPSPRHIALPLADMAGSKVRVVFVNEGNDCGLLGIGRVSVSMYDARIEDRTPIYRTASEAARISASAGICTVAPRVTAKLTVDGVERETLTVDIPEGAGYADYDLPFTTIVEAGDTSTHAYEVILAPEHSGAPSLSTDGTLVFGGGYPAMIVEEEGTGEKCGNCPYGAAGLARFSDLYPDRFIGIAIHCTDVFSGMAMRAPGYSLQFEKNPSNPILSLPSALINRTISVNPSSLSAIDKTVQDLLSSESPLTVHVDRVDFDEATGDVDVTFSTIPCADLSGVRLNAAVVLTADGLVGSGTEWTQSNYLSGVTRPAGVDDSWWEYLKFYFEYPSRHILSADYRYDHVALGIYPDFYGDGAPLPRELSAGAGERMTISFSMPMQTEPNGFGVQDAGRTAVTVMVTDARTGEVLGASKVDAAHYNADLSKVETPSALHVAGDAEFYDMTGHRVNPLQCTHGIYVRRSGSEVRKIIINR